MSFHFIITTSIRNELQSRQLIRCIDSIRKYHELNNIFIINDSDDSIDFLDSFFNNLIQNYSNVKIFPSYNKGCGEQQVFKFILDCKDIDISDNVVYIHDGVIINKEFDHVNDIKDIKFIWHFTNHRPHWDIITYERTQYNIDNNIINHTDLINHYINKYYSDDQLLGEEAKDFKQYALDLMINKNKWVGCQGFMCIINKDSLIKMNNKINFNEIFLKFVTRIERVVNESIFSIICHYCYPDIDFSNSYDGLYYDGVYGPVRQGYETGFDNLKWFFTGNYMSKIGFGR